MHRTLTTLTLVTLCGVLAAGCSSDRRRGVAGATAAVTSGQATPTTTSSNAVALIASRERDQ